MAYARRSPLRAEARHLLVAGELDVAECEPLSDPDKRVEPKQAADTGEGELEEGVLPAHMRELMLECLAFRLGVECCDVQGHQDDGMCAAKHDGSVDVFRPCEPHALSGVGADCAGRAPCVRAPGMRPSLAAHPGKEQPGANDTRVLWAAPIRVGA